MNELHKKLFDLKKEVGKISKDSNNPFFKSKYFDINQLLEHLEPLFQKYNLLCVQPISDGKVTTRLIDVESGDFMDSSLQLSDFKDPQKTGSEVTYFRRYTLQSLLGLQAEDDDGNKASGNVTKPQAKKDDLPVVWLSEKQLESIIQKGNAKEALDYYDGKTERTSPDGKKVKYAMKKAFKEQLQKLSYWNQDLTTQKMS